MLQARMDKTRDKMRRGGLPRPRPYGQRAWTGRGDGTPCSGCGERIERSDTQFDVEFANAVTFSFHAECYEAWTT